MLSDLLYRFRAVFRRADVEHELDDELRFHLDRQIDAYVAGGLSRQTATRRARLDFGGVDQVKEDCRDARGVAALETVHVNLVQGSAFGAEGYVRLSFATSREQINQGVDKLAEFLQG